MLAKQIITKEKFKDFLYKAFVNKDDITLLMYLFMYTRDIELNEKVMFLLYNEYITVDEVLEVVRSQVKKEKDRNENVVDTSRLSGYIVTELQNIINSVPVIFHKYTYTKIFDKTNRSEALDYQVGKPFYTLKSGKYELLNNITSDLYNKYVTENTIPAGTPDNIYVRDSEDVSYKYMKEYFFRDYVTTLTLKNYENIINFYDQIDVIYTSLTSLEKDFLKIYFDIDSFSFVKLVRLQTADNKIELSEAERYINPDVESTAFKGEIEKVSDFPSNPSVGDYYVITKDMDIIENTSMLCHLCKDQVVYNVASKDDDYTYLINGKYWKRITMIPVYSNTLNNTYNTADNYYYRPSIMDNTGSIDFANSKGVRELFLSILNKIYLGTIH